MCITLNKRFANQNHNDTFITFWAVYYKETKNKTRTLVISVKEFQKQVTN